MHGRGGGEGACTDHQDVRFQRGEDLIGGGVRSCIDRERLHAGSFPGKLRQGLFPAGDGQDRRSLAEGGFHD